MALIEPVTDEAATPEQKVIFDYSRKALGRVAEAVRVAANAPRIMQPLFGFMMAIARKEISGTLDARIKTLVALKTSMLNGCEYCVGHNSLVGAALGIGDEEVQALEGDYRQSGLFTDAELAVIDWTHHLTERTHRQHRELMPNLKQHFSDDQIVELTMLCGYWNFWNRFNDGLQMEFEGQAFNARFGKTSKSVDPDEYRDYMNSCWWNDPSAKV